jgi:hypothetical protein
VGIEAVDHEREGLALGGLLEQLPGHAEDAGRVRLGVVPGRKDFVKPRKG